MEAIPREPFDSTVANPSVFSACRGSLAAMQYLPSTSGPARSRRTIPSRVRVGRSNTLTICLVVIALASFIPRMTFASSPKKYTNKKHGFSLKLPSSWWYNHAAEDTIIATFGSPDRIMSGAVIQVHEQERVSPSDSVTTLGAIWNSITLGGKESREPAKLSGLPATKFTYRMKLQNGELGQTILLVAAAKGETWAINLIGPLGAFQSRDNPEFRELQAIADSFQLLKPVLDRMNATIWVPGSAEAPIAVAPAGSGAADKVPEKSTFEGESPNGQPGPTPESLNESAPQPPASEWSSAVHVGGQVMAAKLIHHPAPKYPPLARKARLQGFVRLIVLVGEDGQVKDIKILSGHPLLIKPALEAVSAWRYQPTSVEGKRVEVVTEVDINFTLSE